MIPPNQVTMVTRKPHTFIRVTDNDHPYELVFDSRLQGKTDRNGAPVVFSVNDGEAPFVRYRRTKVGVMVCRATANARGGCGYRLIHGKNEWSLLIPRGRLNEAEEIAEEASTLLERFALAS